MIAFTTGGSCLRKPALIAAAAALCVALGISIFAAEGTAYNPALWSGMKYRMIGPNRGGRVTAVTGVPSQPYTFYMGSTGGGVWKTTDAGHSWQNISDAYFTVASIGAIEVSLSNPNVVYVGHRLVEDPQQCLDRPRHVQIDRRGQDVDIGSACAIPDRSPPCA